VVDGMADIDVVTKEIADVLASLPKHAEITTI
jgi:hypothetical protein